MDRWKTSTRAFQSVEREHRGTQEKGKSVWGSCEGPCHPPSSQKLMSGWAQITSCLKIVISGG